MLPAKSGACQWKQGCVAIVDAGSAVLAMLRMLRALVDLQGELHNNSI